MQGCALQNQNNTIISIIINMLKITAAQLNEQRDSGQSQREPRRHDAVPRYGMLITSLLSL
jgi:hypothetical protein